MSKARRRRLIATACLLVAAACASPGPTTKAASRDAWYGVPTASTSGGVTTGFAIDLYETGQGLAGRAHLASGATYALRNIERTDAHLSFIVTASDPVTPFD